MKILNKELIKKSEESAVLTGTFSLRELMFNAGTRAGKIIEEKLSPQNKKIAVVCGKGNNGGDGFVIADYLYGIGADVTVIMPFGKPETENAIYYYDKLKFVKFSDNLESDYDIIIDALFGIGYKIKDDKSTLDIFNALNSASGIKVSIDIPSGVETDSGRIRETAVKADYTITFIAPKPCFFLPEGSDFCGEVIVADIGAEPMGYTYLTTEKPIFPKRRHNSHKGNYGKALLINGSYGMAGAAILAAKAALRSGLGIATCVLCDGIYSPFTSSVPEAVCLPIKQTKNGVLNSESVNINSLKENADAILFGCGVGKGSDINKILEDIILNSDLPTVIDADGINALAQNINILKKSKAPIILTPHPGEMARLCGISIQEVESNRVNAAQDFAKEYGVTVILKGANTIIAHPNGRVFINATGNPGMATGGSGDVLSGITVSLLAQGYETEFSANAAVYLHGAAGDKAASKRSFHALLPSDIIEEL